MLFSLLRAKAQQFKFDISNYPSGIYFMKVVTAKVFTQANFKTKLTRFTCNLRDAPTGYTVRTFFICMADLVLYLDHF